MGALLGPFEATAFHLFGAPTTWGELLGFATGIACVALVVRRHVANWPMGLANNALFFALFLHAGLFADAGLQIAFAVLAVYGWWSWTQGRAVIGEALPITRTTPLQWITLGVVGVAATAVLWQVLTAHTSSTVPFPDALTTVLSLLATWGQARKKVESWWLWIAADVIYVPLYHHKNLTLTALLYVVFGLLCLAGLRAWRRQLRVETARRAPLVGVPT